MPTIFHIQIRADKTWLQSPRVYVSRARAFEDAMRLTGRNGVWFFMLVERDVRCEPSDESKSASAGGSSIIDGILGSK